MDIMGKAVTPFANVKTGIPVRTSLHISGRYVHLIPWRAAIHYHARC